MNDYNDTMNDYNDAMDTERTAIASLPVCSSHELELDLLEESEELVEEKLHRPRHVWVKASCSTRSHRHIQRQEAS